MKKMTCFVIAMALVLGLAQCKKETIEPQGEQVRITLNVDGGASTGSATNGSRAEVDPPHVTFEDDDQILVASGGKYVGTLTRTEGVFSGNITNPVEGQRLYFYFLGNKVDVESLTPGSTEECTVNISDQTDYPHLPVISMGKSMEDYASGTTSYTSRLYNKASLMKFNVTTPSTAPICITGMNNTVTVDFGNPTDAGFEYGMDGDGVIKMAAGSGTTANPAVKWAIVLPQDELASSFGLVYSEDLDNESNCYLGLRPIIPAIGPNQYIISGVDPMTINISKYVDIDTLGATYTAQNNQVLFDGLDNPNSFVLNIADGAAITLRDATVSGGILGLGDATIVLEGDNNVDVSGIEYRAGVRVNEDNTLVIRGSGSLTAIGGNRGAGIGSGYNDRCGNILIQSGTIHATGNGQGASGIGSASLGSSCGSITIEGGTIYATGGTLYATGIGAGGSSCGPITIKGGTVYATGGVSSAGIGDAGISCGNILIQGGVIEATGGDGGQGIGAQDNDITIKGNAHVTARGTGNASGIGSGPNPNYSGRIYIEGGTVFAYGGSQSNSAGGAGIGSGAGSINVYDNDFITISGGYVDATGGNRASGIGCGSSSTVRGNIIISGGTIVAKAGTGNNSAIGPSQTNKHTGVINITSGAQSITATITCTHSRAFCIGGSNRINFSSLIIDGHQYSNGTSSGTYDPEGDVGNTPAFVGAYDSDTRTYTLTHK